MINAESNGNGGAINGTDAPAQDKQEHTPIVKKTALRDLQNENLLSNSMQKQQKSGEAVKVSGTKRLTPERPLGSMFLPSLAQSGANENVMNARRRFDLEFGKGRYQNKIESFSVSSHLEMINQPRQDIPKVANQARDRNVRQTPVVMPNVRQTPVAMPNNMTPTVAFSSATPSFPTSFGRNNVSEATKVPVKNNSDQLRSERLAGLQKFLTQCDEANQKEFLKKLLLLSPAELSKHAWELERRAMNLALEEGKEEERRKSLNILVKLSTSNSLLQSSKS